MLEDKEEIRKFNLMIIEGIRDFKHKVETEIDVDCFQEDCQSCVYMVICMLVDGLNFTERQYIRPLGINL